MSGKKTISIIVFIVIINVIITYVIYYNMVNDIKDTKDSDYIIYSIDGIFPMNITYDLILPVFLKRNGSEVAEFMYYNLHDTDNYSVTIVNTIYGKGLEIKGNGSIEINIKVEGEYQYPRLSLNNNDTEYPVTVQPQYWCYLKFNGKFNNMKINLKGETVHIRNCVGCSHGIGVSLHIDNQISNDIIGWQIVKGMIITD